MTSSLSPGGQSHDPTVSLWSVAALAVERRRLLAWSVAAGVFVAAVIIVVRGTNYESIATVMPSTQSGSESRLAGLASQFGIGELPVGKDGGFALSADLIVQLASSPTILGRVVGATAQLNGRETPLLDILAPEEGAAAADSAERRQDAIRALQHRVEVRRNKQSGTVSLVAATKWPEVSEAVAAALVAELNEYTFELASTQAQAERRFITARLTDREEALRRAEGQLSSFVLQNRQYQASPNRMFEYERLQREVTLQQQILTGLAQSSEDAAIREVRDTPALVVVERPTVPVRPLARRRPLILVFGALIGFGIGLVAVVALAVARALDASGDEGWRSFRASVARPFRREGAR